MATVPASLFPDTSSARHVVFFDGLCGFCDWIVRWLMARDPEAVLRFAPLQGATAEKLRSTHPEFPKQMDTLAYADLGASPIAIEIRSRAVFRILRLLPGPARHLAHLEVLPRSVTDLGYRALARSRYLLFGRLDACAVPPPEVRRRFLA